MEKTGMQSAWLRCSKLDSCLWLGIYCVLRVSWLFVLFDAALCPVIVFIKVWMSLNVDWENEYCCPIFSFMFWGGNSCAYGYMRCLWKSLGVAKDLVQLKYLWLFWDANLLTGWVILQNCLIAIYFFNWRYHKVMNTLWHATVSKLSYIPFSVIDKSIVCR